MNWDHLAAIAVGGAGGIALILSGQPTAGAVLLGATVGYAFKNGSEASIVAAVSAATTPAPKP
jgi:hypothetical protein